tara:strand:- start:14 stop:520 length:507 start_codon:yes stop_codon:yes gene_type:complete
MIIRENYDVMINKHPHYKSVNKKLLEEMNVLEDDSYRNKIAVEAKVTDWDLDTPTVNLILSWIATLLRTHYSWIDKKSEKLYFIDRWFANYKKGDCSTPHEHSPNTWSWVYFINTPSGSSPIVFTTSGKKVKAEEGKIVIFPSNVYHHVPKSRCDRRVVLAGNVRCKK